MPDIQRANTLKVVVIGLFFWASYETFLASITSPGSMDPCDKDDDCIYSLWSTEGLPGTYPVNPFKFTPVYNGQAADSEIDWQSISWLEEKGNSPHCPGSTQKEDQAMCKKYTTVDLQKAINEWFPQHKSIWIYKFGLRGWASTRILHDILLLHRWPFGVTINISHLSTILMFVAALSGVFVTWNALTLMMIQNADKHCACFYRLNLSASVIVVSVPFTLTLTFLAKIEDTLRAHLGGDYFLTKKFHIAHDLQVSRRLNPLTSVLGAGALGKRGFTSSGTEDLVPEKVVGQRLVSIMITLAVLTLLVAWAFPMPLFIHRAITIYFQIGPFADNTDSKAILRWMLYFFREVYAAGTIFFTFFFLIARSPFLPRSAEFMHVLSSIPTLIFISDPSNWLWSDEFWRLSWIPKSISVHFIVDSNEKRAKVLWEALKRCPEVADEERLNKLLIDHWSDETRKEQAKNILKRAFQGFDGEEPLLRSSSQASS